ncbi:hypothetical protein KR032_010955, partial [Drosophila birchii]
HSENKLTMIRAVWKLLILLQIARLTLSRDYVPDNEGLFAECLNPPPGSKSFNDVADISKFISKREKDGLHISGNITLHWDVDPNDRVEVEIALLRKDGDKWKATAIAAKVGDFCKEMYEKKTLYYPYSTKYIANKPEIKEKCITHTGTLLVVEPFDLKVVLSPAVPLMPGHHRVIVKLTAVSKAGVPNPNSICFEIPGKVV